MWICSNSGCCCFILLRTRLVKLLGHDAPVDWSRINRLRYQCLLLRATARSVARLLLVNDRLKDVKLVAFSKLLLNNF
jgi:hypothetical protein